MPFFEYQRSARRQTTHLLLAFAVAVLLLVLVANAALWLAFMLFSPGMGVPRFFFEVNTGVILFFVLGGWWIESDALTKGGEALARRAGARELRPQRNPSEQQLEHIVREMATAAHVPVPAVMVWPRQRQINAFAAGLTLQDAVIVVTEGALDALNRAEIQGLVAHELSHIVEGDTRLNTRLIGMVFGLEMVYRFGRRMADVDDDGRNPLGAMALLRWLIGIPLMATGSLGWLAGRLLCAAVSRQREYLADARAVQWTRNPHGLGGVLRKIREQHAQEEQWQQTYARPAAQEEDDDGSVFNPLQQQQSLLAHMMLSTPARTTARHRLQHWLGDALSTHPSLEERLRRIYGLDV